MPKKKKANSPEPFQNQEEALNFFIKESEKDPEKEEIIEKATIMCENRKRLVNLISPKSIAYDHPPQSEHSRISGFNSQHQLVKCGISAISH